MSLSIIIYLLISLAIAAVIIVISVIAYNRRLDRIARGEERDTHSPIPEPKDTASIIYKTVLIGIVILSFLTVSAMKGTLSSMQNSLNNLNAQISSMSTEIYNLREQLADQDKLVLSTDCNIRNLDLETQTAEIRYTVTLKEYTEDTAVSLNLDGQLLALDKLSPSTYGKTITADIFRDYERTFVHVTRGGTTVTEEVEFPSMLFYDCLPIPSLSCKMNSSYKSGKWTYSGEFTVRTDCQEEIESVTLTYLTGGKTLKTMDITAETLNENIIYLDKGMELEYDLTARIEIATRSGYRVVDETILFYETSGEELFPETPLTILDPEGRTVWQNEKY